MYVKNGRKRLTEGDAAVLTAAEAMDREGELLSARPALETEGLRFLHVTGESPRAEGHRVARRQLPGAPPCWVGRGLCAAGCRERPGLQPGVGRCSGFCCGPGPRVEAVGSRPRLLYAQRALPVAVAGPTRP